MTTAWLGLGTNLGDRRTNLRRALDLIGEIGVIEALSSVYESEPVGYRAQPDFWNLVLRLRTELTPWELLRATQEIETRLGRVRSFENAPRTIDIDILLYGDQTTDEPELTIPHPRIGERAFVLRPLLELDPELHDPRTGRRIAELLETGELEEIRKSFPGTEL